MALEDRIDKVEKQIFKLVKEKSWITKKLAELSSNLEKLKGER